MALRWLEGFDGPNNNTELLGRLYSNVPTSQGNSEDGATVDSDEARGDDDSFLTTNALVGTPTNSWIFGFAFRADDTQEIDDGSNFPYVAMENSDGEQLRIEFVDDNPVSSKPGGLYYKLRIMRGVTEIASSNERFILGDTDNDEWCFFEFKVTIDNASGSVEGRYRWSRSPSRQPGGGHTTLTWDAAVSSIDTQEQTSTGADRFTVSWNSGNANDSVAFDDIYVCDTSGTKNNDYLGKIVIQKQFLPDGASGEGDTTDWTLVTATSTGDAWEEPHSNTEDDDRTTSDATGQIHLGDYDPLPPEISGANIIGVRKDIHGRMETTGTLNIGHMWRKTTGTPTQVEFGTALNVSSTSLVANTVIAEDDPNTGTDWVNADLDTYQYGVKNNG